MNRGRSRDSLDNFDDDPIGSSSDSSSPTNFTSDDESHVGNLMRAKSKSRCHVKLSDEKQRRLHKALSESPVFGNTIIKKQAPGSSTLEPTERLLPAHFRHPNHANTSNADITASNFDSYYKTYLSNSLNEYPLRKLDVSPDSTLKSKNFDFNEINYGELNDEPRNQLSQSRNFVQSNDDGKVMDVMEDAAGNYYLVDQLQDHNLLRPRPTRGPSSMASRMCSRLMECRTLIEAIEFVEQNRDLIEEITRIITHEAPAYRNYDMSNYQIDYSVKESFNPNFWLDREPIVTTADGNCQYHAISLSLTGSEEYTSEVRLATAIAVLDNREWFDSVLKLVDGGTVLDLIYTIVRNHSWGDETTLKAIAVGINRRIFLYACNMGKKDYEMVKLLSRDELLDAFKEKKYRGGTGIHTYADPLIHVPANNYIMLFHKSEHFIAVLPTTQQPTMFEPYNPIVPVFN